MYRIKVFFRRIKNLIRWFPIIWKDQDWDHHFIYEILKFKLKNQAKYIGGRGNHVSAKRDAEKMMLCVSLISKLQNEYYGTEHFDYYKSEIEFIPSKSFPEHLEMIDKKISENLDEYFKKYPRIYKQVINTNNKLPFKKKDKYGVAINVAYINEERAHKLLFKILEQNIRRWWD
jgi:hypothetical protein